MLNPNPITKTSLAVEVSAASKVYGASNQALLPVDLNIVRGEFVSLLGPSGCGKSTLLKMIAGLITPTSGKVQIRTQEISKDSQSQTPRLSFVFQSPTLMPWADVITNVRLPLDLAGVPKDIGNASADEMLARVGLTDFANALPRA